MSVDGALEMTLSVLVRGMSAFVQQCVDCKTPTAICPDLTLTNGGISYSPTSSPILEGAVATHSCVTGYQLSSSPSTRMCQSDRMWSGDDITCEGTYKFSSYNIYIK